MIAAGVSECSPKLEQYYVNVNGEVCDEIDAEGLKCSINITHPEYILFGEEFGADTANEENVHVGGQTNLSCRNTTVNITAIKERHRFTVIGLTTGTGEPVCCVVTFSVSKLDVLD